MNADENKMLIGVYLRSSAAISVFFTVSHGRREAAVGTIVSARALR
jgi:hypothetical protein